jgi:hypothetical protein
MSGGPTRIAVLDVSVSDADAVLKAADATHSGLMKAGDRASVDAALGGGVCASGRLKLATGPTANDTVTIGGHTFKFVASLGVVVAQTQILNGTAAQARARLVEAINGTVDATNVTPGSTPFSGSVVADALDTDKVRVRSADAQGGNAVGSAASVAVSSSLTAGSDGWDVANLDETGVPNNKKKATGQVTITAAMVTRGKAYVDLPFTPTQFTWSARTSTGAIRAITDTVSIEGSAIKITLAGGASPNLQAGDIVAVTATE